MKTIILSMFFVHLLYANSLTDSMDALKRELTGYMNQNSIVLKRRMIDNRESIIQKIGAIWGYDNVKLSSQKKTVIYDDNLTTRGIVDFKNGSMTIQKIENNNSSIATGQMLKKVDDIGKLRLSEVAKKTPLIDLKNNNKVFGNRDFNSLFNIDKSSVKQKVVNKNGKKIYEIYAKLSKNSVDKRIKLYLPYIQKYAKKYSFDTSYILSIIHTESAFNPFAISNIPAYGLMQIDPKTGGKDAYIALYQKDENIPKDYLFDPKKNIELGSKYLQIIRDSYLDGVKNSKSLQYCISVAYNAGIGNLYRVFSKNGSNKEEIIKKINKMSSDDVYHLLHNSKKLTNEAKQYLALTSYRNQQYKNYN